MLYFKVKLVVVSLVLDAVLPTLAQSSTTLYLSSQTDINVTTTAESVTKGREMTRKGGSAFPNDKLVILLVSLFAVFAFVGTALFYYCKHRRNKEIARQSAYKINFENFENENSPYESTTYPDTEQARARYQASLERNRQRHLGSNNDTVLDDLESEWHKEPDPSSASAYAATAAMSDDTNQIGSKHHIQITPNHGQADENARSNSPSAQHGLDNPSFTLGID